MTYYLVPKTKINLYESIDYIESNSTNVPIISNSLSSYLYEIKNKLNGVEKEWNTFKKYTNPYEYVNSIVPYKKKSVSKINHLSRSYYKMIEMIMIFDISFSSPIQSFHLAEGPGGFIEAIIDIRKNKEDTYIGMTLLQDKNDPTIPTWKQSEYFLKRHTNILLENGIDNTGNILSYDNFLYCTEKYGSSMEFITADGGFDFSLDFNNQESTISNLLFAQICYALTMQKEDGVFILKIFDCFMQQTIDLLYLLSSFYKKTYICKPNTSRYANSEKYIICKGFLFSKNEMFVPYLNNAFKKMNHAIENGLYVHRFLTVPVPYFFIIKMEEYNAIFGQKQIENIHYTILLIDNKHKQDKIDVLIHLNIQKCIQWCVKYNIEYNTF